MSPALYLIDTSGLFRILQDKLRQAWSEQLTAGVVAICPIVELEFLYSARSLADRLEKRRLLRELFGWVTMNDQAYDRASEIQQRLTETGKHRSAGPVDLLIAATAERERLIVLCDDRDFQTVASVTGQPVKLVTDVLSECLVHGVVLVQHRRMHPRLGGYLSGPASPAVPVSVVDPAFVVDRGSYSCHNTPWKPDPPRSFPDRGTGQRRQLPAGFAGLVRICACAGHNTRRLGLAGLSKHPLGRQAG